MKLQQLSGHETTDAVHRQEPLVGLGIADTFKATSEFAAGEA
jgi:hypothetical protein